MIDKKKAEEFLRDIGNTRDLLGMAESVLDEYKYTESMARTIGAIVEQLRGVDLGVRIMFERDMQEEANEAE